MEIDRGEEKSHIANPISHVVVHDVDRSTGRKYCTEILIHAHDHNRTTTCDVIKVNPVRRTLPSIQEQNTQSN